MSPSATPWQQIRGFLHRGRRSAMFLGALGTGLRLGGNLVLAPMLAALFPPEQLSVWWVFLAFGALANLADFGFGPVISRVYGYLWAGAEDFDAEGLRPPPQDGRPNLPRLREFSATVRRLYWKLAVGATLALGLVGTLFLLEPVGQTGRGAQIWPVWGLYVMVVGINLGTSHWMLACLGLNRVRQVQAANLWSGLAYVGLALGLLLAGAGFPSLVAATAARALVSWRLLRRTCLEALPGPEALPVPGMLKRLWPNAYKFGTVAIGAYCLAYGNVLVATRFLPAELSASFGLTAQVGTFLVNFAGLWMSVKVPELTILRAQGRQREMAALFARRLALTLGSFLVLAAAAALLGNFFLEWKGARTRLLPAPQLVFYLAYLAIQLCYVQFGSLTYTENVMPFFRVGLLTGLGMFALSLVMTPLLGMWGLLAAPLIAESACSSWFTIRRGFRGQPLSPRQFFRAALGAAP